MTRDRYTVVRYFYERGYDDEDDELVAETTHKTDLRGALNAYDSDYWDYQDWRDDEVILYPADVSMNTRGIIETVHTVIKAEPRHMDHLYSATEARAAA